jgi:hypothetical protein
MVQTETISQNKSFLVIFSGICQRDRKSDYHVGIPLEKQACAVLRSDGMPSGEQHKI